MRNPLRVSTAIMEIEVVLHDLKVAMETHRCPELTPTYAEWAEEMINCQLLDVKTELQALLTDMDKGIV